MTWEQFVGAALGLALVALGRLLDKYLPPTESHPEPDPGSYHATNIPDLDVTRESPPPSQEPPAEPEATPPT